MTAVICLLGGSSLVYQSNIVNDLRVRAYRENQQQIVLILSDTRGAREGFAPGSVSSASHQNKSGHSRSHEEDPNQKEILYGIKEAFGTTPTPDEEQLEVGLKILTKTHHNKTMRIDTS